MNTTLPSYEEQKSKIIQAYFKDEIRPFNANFCFCGTLSPDADWADRVINDSFQKYPYSINEYERMERALFSTFPDVEYQECGLMDYRGTPQSYKNEHQSNYEQFLFEGMCAALDVLKQIHIEHGEIITEDIPLTRRKLLTS